MDMNDLRDSLREISILEDLESTLLLTSGENFRDAAFLSAKVLTENDKNLIYFTANSPLKELMDELEYEGVDVSRLYFLDVISKKLNIDFKDQKKVYYGKTPAEINNLLMNVTDVLEKWSDEADFLILDSFTGLLIYNDIKDAGRLLQRTDEKIKDKSVKGIYIALKEQLDEETIDKLMKICDRKIDLTKN